MWTRFDDRLFESRKLRRLGRDGFLFYIASIVYSSHHLTDGVIRAHDLPTITLWAWQKTEDLQTLIPLLTQPDPDTGRPCWEEIAIDTWQIHDYLEFHPTRAELTAKRKRVSDQRRAAGQAGAEARWQPDSTDHGKPMANGMANAKQTDGPVPVPPIPLSPDPQDPRSSVARAPTHDPAHTNEANELNAILTITQTAPTKLDLERLQHAIASQPDTDPVAVALEYLQYRSRTPAERRRPILDGWLLAMASATQRNFYQRPPPPPAPLEPATAPPTGHTTWDAIADTIARIYPEVYTEFIAPLAPQARGPTILLTPPENHRAEYYAGRLAHPLDETCRRLSLDLPPIEWQEHTT